MSSVPCFGTEPLMSLDARAHELLPALERRELALPHAGERSRVCANTRSGTRSCTR